MRFVPQRLSNENEQMGAVRWKFKENENLFSEGNVVIRVTKARRATTRKKGNQKMNIDYQ